MRTYLALLALVMLPLAGCGGVADAALARDVAIRVAENLQAL